MSRHGKPPQLKRLRDDAMLDISDAIIAGRHSSCGISLAHEEGASRKHARFNIKNGRLTITDLGSLNGTLVNGIEIDDTQVLEDSDIIIFDTDKYLLSVPRILPTSPVASNSSADTVIANKAERLNPDSIESAIKVLPEQAKKRATNQAEPKPQINQAARPENHVDAEQSANTMEYLNSLPTPDMKRPVGMPEKNLSTDNEKQPITRTARKWLVPLLLLVVIVFVSYQLGLRGS